MYIGPQAAVVAVAVSEGATLTVTEVVAAHPPGVTYVIIAAPNDTPVSMPELAPIVAAEDGVDHVPPVTVEDRVRVEPTHTHPPPVMVPGAGLTVTTAVDVELPHADDIV